MAVVERSALVFKPADYMFSLVNDIAAYPEFLPWCEQATVQEQSPDHILATLLLRKGKLRKSFTTHNRLHYPYKMELSLVNGPFSKLQGYWQFEPLSDQASRVSLHLEFEIDNPLLRLTMQPIFHQIADSLVDAFYRRALSQ